ncbi:MAG: hypothetical protein AB1898_24035 [Acidobacteriota bacterium]
MPNPSQVDFRQLWLLTKTAVRTSFRSAESDPVTGDRSIRSGFRNMVVTYLLTSVALCALSAICGNQITYNTLLISYGMMMTAFAVLIEYNDLVLSSDDAEILFCRPVTSQTLYWSRLLTLAIYILCYAGALLTLPGLVSFRYSWDRLYWFPVVLGLMLLACLTSACLVVQLYLQLLKWVQPARLTAVLTWVQVSFSLLMFYGYYKFLLYQQSQERVSIALAVENVQKAAAAGANPFRFTLDQSPFFHLVPPAWFAGVIQGLLGERGAPVSLLVWSAALFIGLASWLAIRNGPVSYLRHLMRLGSHSPTRLPRRPRLLQRPPRILQRSSPGMSFLAGFGLVCRYFQRDGRLRRGVFPFFGIVLFYCLYGIENPHFLMDLFQASSPLEALGAHQSYLLMPLCVLIATNAVKYSSDWQASWIFRVAPVDRTGFHFGYRLALVLKMILPVWLLVTAVYSFLIPVESLLPQMLGLFGILCLLLSLSFLWDVHWPLSEAPRVHAGFLKFTGAMILLAAVGDGLMVAEYLASGQRVTAALFYAGLFGAVVLSLLVEWKRVKQAG